MRREARTVRPISVLVADDIPVVREGLRRMLEAEGKVRVVGEAETSEEVVQMALQVRPDVILLDWKMPGCGSVEAIRRIRERLPEARVIVLTLYGEQYLGEAMRAGAMGYLLKDASREEMLRAMDSAMKGEPYLDPSLGRHLFLQFAAQARGRLGLGLSLSSRERDILRLASQGATNKVIAARLSLSSSTVKREISQIFTKLEVRGRAEATAWANRQELI